VRYRFFADPVYGGNRDMAAWKMIGFPSVQYEYSGWVERHKERYPHPPINIANGNPWPAARPQQWQRGVKQWQQSCRAT
jgi:hypothetical protein